VIAAADDAARAHGVVPGQPLAQAQVLVPGLLVMPAAAGQDAADLARLVRWCLWVAPLTAPDGADGIWIDATGCAHLHGGESAMLARLLDGLRRRGLSGRAAIADTPGAAHALARHGRARLTIVPPGAQQAALDPLPVEALRIVPRTADMLHRLGLGRIGAVRAAPRAPLARRFGPQLLARLDQASGQAAEPIRPVLAPDAMQARRGFVEPLSTSEAFRIVTDVLLADLCATLRGQGMGARRLDLIFERVDGTTCAVRVGTARAVHDPAHLGRLLAERTQDLDPGFGVEAMLLRVTAAERLMPAQEHGIPWTGEGAGSEDAGDAEREAALSALADRLVNRLGPGRVFRLDAVASHMPERGQRRASAVDAASTPWHAPLGRPPPPWHVPWPRPIRLLPAPEAVGVIALLPNHPPRVFTWRGRTHDVARADGPERIRGEWWHPAPDDTLRDYWVVEDAGGRRFWLFRRGDVTSGTAAPCWFLHGLF
jgi:protein ImuB